MLNATDEIKYSASVNAVNVNTRHHRPHPSHGLGPHTSPIPSPSTRTTTTPATTNSVSQPSHPAPTTIKAPHCHHRHAHLHQTAHHQIRSQPTPTPPRPPGGSSTNELSATRLPAASPTSAPDHPPQDAPPTTRNQAHRHLPPLRGGKPGGRHASPHPSRVSPGRGFARRRRRAAGVRGRSADGHRSLSRREPAYLAGRL